MIGGSSIYTYVYGHTAMYTTYTVSHMCMWPHIVYMTTVQQNIHMHAYMHTHSYPHVAYSHLYIHMYIYIYTYLCVIYVCWVYINQAVMRITIRAYIFVIEKYTVIKSQA